MRDECYKNLFCEFELGGKILFQLFSIYFSINKNDWENIIIQYF